MLVELCSLRPMGAAGEWAGGLGGQLLCLLHGTPNPPLCHFFSGPVVGPAPATGNVLRMLGPLQLLTSRYRNFELGPRSWDCGLHTGQFGKPLLAVLGLRTTLGWAVFG